jgi:hypothetical protein
MVRGLFRWDEQDTVLAVPEKSVVFLTTNNIEQVLLGCTWPHRHGTWRTCISAAWMRPCLGRTGNLWRGSKGVGLRYGFAHGVRFGLAIPAYLLASVTGS